MELGGHTNYNVLNGTDQFLSDTVGSQPVNIDQITLHFSLSRLLVYTLANLKTNIICYMVFGLDIT